MDWKAGRRIRGDWRERPAEGGLPIVGALARGVEMPASDDDHVLVLRFWQEDEAAELHSLRHWRARITYVNNGRHFHAPSIDAALDVVKSLLLNGKDRI